MDADPAAAMAELSQAIAREILTLPELADPARDTYAMAAEVTEASVTMTAYRYAGSGPPVPTEEPDDSYLFIQLRERTRGVDGQAWDVVVVKIRRDTADLVMDFWSGPAADPWRITPATIGHLPEALRPRPEDFR